MAHHTGMYTVEEHFADPPKVYRAMPFWAWNCKLSPSVITRQIEIFHRMGMGGFYMHPRIGLDTPYLGNEFMECVQASVEKAQEMGLYAGIYDDDRWPSGTAGGKVTSNKDFLARRLWFSPDKRTSGTYIAAYRVHLDRDGSLKSYERIYEEADEDVDTWFVYEDVVGGWDGHNGFGYVDTMNPKATESFLHLTHDVYRDKVGSCFGHTIPTVFTDEPELVPKECLNRPTDKTPISFPWTDSLLSAYREAFGCDLLDTLPEIVWELPDHALSATRYRFHEILARLFIKGYFYPYRNWCDRYGLKLTGHMMGEDTLESQTKVQGDTMRAYPFFDIPGIDMLCGNFDLVTAKQCQSVVHQRGLHAMLSELDGATGYDFDFRKHKVHGDWQAALGVTHRVPHLAWMSMNGDAKRDYPASIFFQSSWWQEYHLIEDHFARIGIALSEGKPRARVAVLHPVESFWICWGPAAQTIERRNALEDSFRQVTNLLLFNLIDFDLICESLFSDQCEQGGFPLQVGQMRYECVILPPCLTLRETTVDRLTAFAEHGGKLIVCGEEPVYCDGMRSIRPACLWQSGKRIHAIPEELSAEVSPYKDIEITDSSGAHTDDLICQRRHAADYDWLFIARGKPCEESQEPAGRSVSIAINGSYLVEYFDTLTGTHAAVPATVADGKTVIRRVLHAHDSLLYRLKPMQVPGNNAPTDAAVPRGKTLAVPDHVRFIRTEPNVLLLDQAEYRMDSGAWHSKEEILRINDRCCQRLGWKVCNLKQPYAIPDSAAEHVVELRFTIHSRCGHDHVMLAGEFPAGASAVFQGTEIPITSDRYYVDPCISVLKIGRVEAGDSILTISIPYTPKTKMEYFYLLGDFDVRMTDGAPVLDAPREALLFQSITEQGMPFFGGKIKYEIPIVSQGGCISIQVPHYVGIGLMAGIDGAAEKPLHFAPYSADLGRISPGRHVITLTLLCHRHNTFGPIHLVDPELKRIGPPAWRSEGDRWTYGYNTKVMGILEPPIVTEFGEEGYEFSCRW